MISLLFKFKKALLLFLCTGVVFFFSCRKESSTNKDQPRNKQDHLIAVEAKDSLNSILNFRKAPYPDSMEGELAALGEKIIENTADYLNDKNAYNNLSCTNCHLNNGTQAYAGPYIGLSHLFPMYRGREDKMGSLQDRINGCLERSMNGKAIADDSQEMRAIVAYIDHLSKGIQEDEQMVGRGFIEIQVPTRAADPNKGKSVYDQHCVACHQSNGQGFKNPEGRGYLYPPLWGEDSFNDGAGMHRVLTAASFIKGNMPLGATYSNTQLTDEEAYDVAAYINSFSRPIKADKEKDYPDLTKKPKDTPYGPYADSIPQIQHQFGPFDF